MNGESGTPPEDLELLCIGNAMVDVFALGEDGMDIQFGLRENAQHVSMDRMRDILAVLPEFTACSGGGAANAAKIAGLLGIKTAFLGALGAAPLTPDAPAQPAGDKTGLDHFGRLFERQLEDAGVYTCCVRKKSPTGVCLMLEMRDHRTIIAASPSAALELSKEHIDEDLIRRADVVILDGFMLDRQELVRRILELADKYGTPVALDLSTAGLASERVLDIVTYARAYPLIIFMNEDEAIAFYQALGQKPLPPGNEGGLNPGLISLFRDFTSRDIFPVLTVKLGIRGAVVFAGGQVFRAETIPVIPLETTGAGDAFCAAFLAAWIRNRTLTECADLGNRAAREVLDVKGTRVDPKVFANLARQLKQTAAG